MVDLRSQLQSRFERPHRFANFGNLLTRLEVRGFRLHKQTRLDIRSPITAFCGLNGTGKTTLLQLAACSYRQAGSGYKFSDFFAVGPLDPSPFDADAELCVGTWQEDGNLRTITLSRRGSRWSDYRAREERPVLFLGAAQFPPRFEQQDFAFRHARRLTVSSKAPCSGEVSSAVARILGLHYDQMDRAQVSVKTQSSSILSSGCHGLQYSENHMGFGECRVHNLVEKLEAQSEKSLILLEEPEISLHQAAQYRLGEYLISLSYRRQHQILLSTHSEHLLRALPQASRILVARDPNGTIQILPGLASAQAASIMAEGYDKALTVIVEDEVARTILAELLLAAEAHLLMSTRIIVAGYRDDRGQSVGGGQEAIAAAMRTLRGTGLKVAAVLDGDARADPSAFVFCLPGSMPPEVELFNSGAVQAHWSATYRLDVRDFQAGLKDVDHHDWFSRLAQRVGLSKESLIGEAARIYARSVGATTGLIEQLKDAASRK